MDMRTTPASGQTVAVLEVIPESPKLILETPLAKEEGPAVIAQSRSAGSGGGHGSMNVNRG